MARQRNKKESAEEEKEGKQIIEIDEMINKAEEAGEKTNGIAQTEKSFEFSTQQYVLIGALAVLLVYIQIQMLSFGSSGIFTVGDVDITQIKSTSHAVAALFPVDKIKTADDAITIMIPTGIPEYSDKLGGITFDDPVNSMNYLAKWYSTIKNEVKQDSALWQRYLSLAAAPRGISCEFCCGVGPQGVSASGELRCGCAHNPAIQALTLGLMKHTNYNDMQILREAMRWKAIWFPRNMVEIAMKVSGSGGNIGDLPGMVGGC